MKNTTMKVNMVQERTRADSIRAFVEWLRSEERSEGTIAKYTRDVCALLAYLNGRPVTKENVAEWKAHLIEENYAPVTVNSMLASVNTYCRFAGINCKIKLLRIQRRLFREETRDLTKIEYEKLISAAYNN